MAEDFLPGASDYKDCLMLDRHGKNQAATELCGENNSHIGRAHVDVSEGGIVIPKGELPVDWKILPHIHALRSLDRSIVFPGEQVHVLAFVSPKPDTEILTPFRVAEAITENSATMSQSNNNVPEGMVSAEQSGLHENTQKIHEQEGIYGMAHLTAKDQSKHNEILLQRFRNSYYFVRITQSNDQLWARKSAVSPGCSARNPDSPLDEIEIDNGTSRGSFLDRGNFDACSSGGISRNPVSCDMLPNGDIVVLLQINVIDGLFKDPIIEVLQFEKIQEKTASFDNFDSIDNYDPCGNLLKWLLPLENTAHPQSRPFSLLNANSGIGASQRFTSGSQIFSHFRSYSMSSLPQNTSLLPQTIKIQNYMPSYDLEDWDQYSSSELWGNQKIKDTSLLSFRGVALEQDRFFVCCGLEGMYFPGLRWRRKIETLQPLEIHSFAADCNSDDVLCVQIKNVSPIHIPDIVLYIDTITVVFEDSSRSGQQSSVPIACVEAGIEHCLPNLALRRDEEHSFILKLASPVWKKPKSHTENHPVLSISPRSGGTDQYAVLVSYRCNYSESRLLFKHPATWQPRMSRDLIISVASETSKPISGWNGRVTRPPIQVLTLQASNLTSEDLTMTVLAPASSTAPTVGSLSSSPSTPFAPFACVDDIGGKIPNEQDATMRNTGATHFYGQSYGFSPPDHQSSHVIPSSGLGCTHLWLQSRVPLGRVPAHSTATVKLELLPLTDGIITLDTLRIEVKEKGVIYVPEHSLKIHATSSIAPHPL